MGRPPTVAALIAWVVLALPGVAFAGSIAPTRGQLMARTDRGPVPLPIIKTQVIGHISGALAHVKVRQRFHNPNIKPLEAIYVFPLPEDASVHGIVVTNGKRVVKGVIKPRGEALEVYKKARGDGELVALLEQERPNIFTQSVANILPKTDVVVDIEYDVKVSYADGYYSFAYPMVVGARYIPGQLDGKVPVGHGTHPDTDQVPDASRITPPVKRSGRTIDLAITIDPGARVREITSPTHAITSSAAPERGPHALRVALARADEIPNKDFVVRYRLAGSKPAISALSHADQRGGFFTFRFEPPSRPPPGDVTPRELTFVVDTSGSLAGTPLSQIKSAMRRALGDLGPADTFQIITFSRASRRLASRPLEAGAASVARALQFIDRIEADGRTEMMEVVRAALEGGGGGRLRIVCFLTDGYIGDDTRVIAEVGRRLGPDTRVFTVGVGSAPNRYLLERMAEVGRGAAHYILPGESAAAPIEAFYRRIRSPLLTHVAVDWKGLAVRDLSPPAIPDVFAGHPLSVVGRFSRPGSATVEVRGRINGREVVYRVPVKLEQTATNPAIAREWARARVRALALEEARGRDRRDAITRLGLDYSLMTAHTALVAVVGDVAVAPGDLRTLMLPVERPEGMVRDEDGDLTDDEAPEPSAPPVEADVREERAGKAVDAGSVVPAPADASEESETIVTAGRATSGILQRRWRLTLGAGIGVSDSDTAGTLSLGFDRFAGRFAIGTAASLQLRGTEDESVAGSLLLQVSYLDLLGRILAPLRLEISAGAGLSITGESAGLGLGGALKLVPRLLPVGLQLRYDGAVRLGEPDITTITGGVEISF